MRHHNANRKFGRSRDQRRALLTSLALSLIIHGRIKTTEAKAKELRPYIEKLVTKARNTDLTSIRGVIARLMNREPEAMKLIKEIAPRFEGVTGGYTRIMKLPPRKSDASPMALIEFTK
jgi:large subunit ribosomal protein L17